MNAPIGQFVSTYSKPNSENVWNIRPFEFTVGASSIEGSSDRLLNIYVTIPHGKKMIRMDETCWLVDITFAISGEKQS